MKPIIIVNFKAYRESTGGNALMLAKWHETVAKKTGAKIMVAVQNADVFRVSRSLSIPVLAQHADPVEFGAHTGSALPEDLKENGAWGALINHSEDRTTAENIGRIIKRCRSAGLKTVVCVENLEKAAKTAKMKPDYLAFEEPGLIGTLKSVSQLEPDSIRKFAEIVGKSNKAGRGKTIPLCGAGVANGEDVAKALELGAKGVLVATAVVKSKNPKKALGEMIMMTGKQAL